jgi:hypothetical protein
MPYANAFIKVVTEKGWLNIRNLFIDNVMNISIPATWGFVALDTTEEDEEVIYHGALIKPMDASINSIYFTADRFNALKPMFQVTSRPFEMVQGYDLAIFDKFKYDSEISDLIDFSALDSDTYINKDTAIYVREIEDGAPDPAEYELVGFRDGRAVVLKAMNVDEMYKVGNFYMSKSYWDIFQENQTAFKAWLADNLGIDPIKLI